MADKTKTKTKKTDVEMTDLINRAKEADVTVDPAWPIDAVRAVVEASEAKAQAEQAKKRPSKARTPREVFIGRSSGDLADIYRQFIQDPAWGSKKAKADMNGTEKTALQHGLKFLSVLFMEGQLVADLEDKIRAAFPHEE